MIKFCRHSEAFRGKGCHFLKLQILSVLSFSGDTCRMCLLRLLKAEMDREVHLRPKCFSLSHRIISQGLLCH